MSFLISLQMPRRLLKLRRWITTSKTGKDEVADSGAGLVIWYSYLWQDEADAGHEAGLKDRPSGRATASSGPDQIFLRPLTGKSGKSAAYGLLPKAVFDMVRNRLLARIRARRSGMVRRTEG